jgi:signal transduction histidine kinase
MTYELLAHQIQMNRISWVFEKGDNVPPVLGDSNMLQQVFTNLIINAMDAFEGKTNGQFEICVRIYGKDHHVFVELEDNGMGIPEKIQEHIFDPFFTTKSEGKGTGLGLAIIASILHQHGAEISLESKDGQGTIFIIRFSTLERRPFNIIG